MTTEEKTETALKMCKYRTFTRSATNWASFSSARKRTVDRNLSYADAQRACRAFNETLTASQIKRGTKLEFEQC